MNTNKHPTPNIQHPTSNSQEPTIEMAGGEVWEFREGEAGRRRFDLEECPLPTLVFVISEADELTRIFFSSIQTAKRNALADKRPGSRPIGNSSSQAG
jgi:hypothetical protein